MNALTVTLIAFIVIGAATNGWTGAVVGGALGWVTNMAIGVIVRRVRGGQMPREVRRSLAVNLIGNHHSVVGTAFFGLTGTSLLSRVESAIEAVCQDAAFSSPAGTDIFTGPHLAAALARAYSREASPAMRAFYNALAQQMAADWLRAPPSKIPEEFASMMGFRTAADMEDAIAIAAFDGIDAIHSRSRFENMLLLGSRVRIHDVAEAIRRGTFSLEYPGFNAERAIIGGGNGDAIADYDPVDDEEFDE